MRKVNTRSTIVLLACAVLSGALGSSGRAGGPPGGDIGALAIDPLTPTTYYAGSSGGVFKSLDAGASWELASTGPTGLFVQCLAIDPLTPTTLYAGTDEGVSKSTDAGASGLRHTLCTLSSCRLKGRRCHDSLCSVGARHAEPGHAVACTYDSYRLGFAVAVGTIIADRPPAQIRTCAANAYGSYLGCLASKRTLGYGCRMRGYGSQRSKIAQCRSHFMRRWLRLRNTCHHTN